MKSRLAKSASRGRSRGSTLLELVFALAILALMMIGTLQLFSLSLAVNKGAAARTEMLLRCQQVVENIRYVTYLSRATLTPPAGTGIPATLPDTLTRFDLPYDTGDPGYAYWGPLGANVITAPKGPYKIRYSIESTSGSATPMHVITVTAVPTDDATAASRYFGIGLKSGRRIDYVAQF